MAIEVSGVTKTYGEQKALDDVSFSVSRGEITGFLGPNGAGKSTMMKIITCFIPPTSGKVTVAGIDIGEHPLEVKKRVGYLPEHNPLYLEMYVKEYLEFAGRIHHVKNLRARIREMVGLTGLDREQNKKIGMLSKGYRQRVGLAQALIHDPEVLILDEPTSGLDPNQLTEVRKLIRDIGRAKTVMLSTHIMQEVEAVCDRVVIINQGRIVANSKASELSSLTSGNKILFSIEFDRDPVKNKLLALPGVVSARKESGHAWVVEACEDIRPVLFRFAVDNGLTVLTMQKQEQKLEEVFKELTSGNQGKRS